MRSGFALGLAAAARVPASPLLFLSSNMFHGPTCSHGVPVAGGGGVGGDGDGAGDGDAAGVVHVKLGSGAGAGGPILITLVMNWMKPGHLPGNAAQEPFAFK